MKTTEYLDAAKHAIAGRSYAGKGSFVLTYAMGQIICRRKSLCTDTMPVFAYVSDTDALRGFTSKQWNTLFGNIHRYFKKKKGGTKNVTKPKNLIS